MSGLVRSLESPSLLTMTMRARVTLLPGLLMKRRRRRRRKKKMKRKRQNLNQKSNLRLRLKKSRKKKSLHSDQADL